MLNYFESYEDEEQQQKPNIYKITNYEINLNKQLGTGSFGEVYLCKHLPTSEIRAIKMLNKQEITQNQYMVNAFKTQISIMSKIKSDNIVKFHEFLESDNHYFIVMEYCEGGTLQKYMKKSKKISEEEAKMLLQQICNGFMALIREGIIHRYLLQQLRDLKPANMLIKSDKIKIIDFGFSKQSHNLKAIIRTPVGTPLYMPIEVLATMPYTSKCDIWSLGFIYYEMLHGKKPFDAQREYELAQKIRNQKIQFDPHISDHSKDFILKCLKTYEADRIGWEQLFDHPVLEGHFDQFKKKNQIFENKFKRIMGQVRFLINSQNLDVQKMMERLSFKKESQITFEQFAKLMKSMHPDITEEELYYLFSHIDSDNNQTLSFQNWIEALKECSISNYEICLESIVEIAKIDSFRRINSMKNIELESRQKQKQKICEKLERCFVQLHRTLCLKKKTLYQIFEKYDILKTGSLTFDQFATEILKYQNFSEEELHLAFAFIDTDGSNSIEFDEFNQYFCHVNKISPSLMFPIDIHEMMKANQKKKFAKRKSSTFLEGGSGGFILDVLKQKLTETVEQKIKQKEKQ